MRPEQKDRHKQEPGKRKTSSRKDIFVTQPFLPPLQDFVKSLKDIWSSKWVTNNGKFHNRLEKELADYLGVPHCSLFCNGTTALLAGLKAKGISGPVITTPFSFPATVHVLPWNGNVPVFCDVDLCLPIYPELAIKDAQRIVDLVGKGERR